jgi:hypothetical protein
VPARSGTRWLATGWRLFRAAPFGWVLLVFVYWMLMTTLSLLPYAGIGIATLLVPAFSVGFMAASRAASRRQSVELGQLFAGLRGRAGAQLGLGAIYFASLALLLGATTLADGGTLALWMLGGQHPDDEAVQSGEFLAALGVAGLLYTPVMMLFWFAPVLVAWHGMRPGQALFYSFFAGLMNWRAFLAYGAAATLLSVVLPFLVLFAIIAATGGAPGPAVRLVFPLLLLLLPVLFASFYASYRDVFAAGDDTRPEGD